MQDEIILKACSKCKRGMEYNHSIQDYFCEYCYKKELLIRKEAERRRRSNSDLNVKRLRELGV